MLSIGEFAHSTMLSIKTIRYYQELGILLPDRIDKGTGYRYYDQKSYDRARSIQMLKDLGFTLNEIRLILTECRDEEDLFLYIDQKLNGRGETLRLILTTPVISVINSMEAMNRSVTPSHLFTSSTAGL
jgi:DNA-binding transcriptional MerR regulator